MKRSKKNNFKERVYQVVRKIPAGQTMSYKEVAEAAGFPRAWRAVGNVLSKNRDYDGIPCHRVIRSDGKVGGYNRGREKKIALLRKEGAILKE